MERKLKDMDAAFMDTAHPEHNTMAAYGWMALRY